MLASLLSFNVGVELGQLLVLVVMIPALELLFRYVVAERTGTIILSALVAHTAWHWMVERWEVLADDEKKGLQERAKKGLGHIDGIISYVHAAENE